MLDGMVLVTSLRQGSLSRLDNKLFYPQNRSSALVVHVPGKHVHLKSIVDILSAPVNKVAHPAWEYKAVYVATIDLA